ncbi:MAG: hypothetical protein ACD_79C01265G0003 [uncultured bacterium]|nr:MAG: hypothetical protein ACD_79C01265G0003 [uncultured bacterium]
MNKKPGVRKFAFRGITLPEMLIAVTLISVCTPIVLTTMSNVSKNYQGTRFISDTTANISTFIQNFKNLAYMSSAAIYHDNGLNNGMPQPGLSDYSASAPAANDAVFLCQIPGYEAQYPQGWCKILVEPMPNPNPHDLMQICWFQCAEGTVGNPGRLDDQEDTPTTQKYILLQNVKRDDWTTSNSGKEPIFRLFYNNPQDSTSGAAGLIVKCRVALLAQFEKGIIDTVAFETGVYFKNNESNF